MVHARHPYGTLQDYVGIEADSAIKHEFIEGRILAMAGGTVEHGRLAFAIGIALGPSLKGTGCFIASSDVRIGHEASDFRAYPDASIIYGSPTYAATPSHTVTNPKVIIEVTSDRTEAYDRGAKLEAYRAPTTSTRPMPILSRDSSKRPG